MMDLIHYSNALLGEVESVEQQADPTCKPSGLWVSDDDCEDNWRAWCEAEDYHVGHLRWRHRVNLRPDAKIVRLSSANEIDAFTKKYHRPPWIGASSYFIDWDAVADDFAGIIITPYVWARRLEGAAWYYGWDCASGCIWDASAIASMSVVSCRWSNSRWFRIGGIDP